FAASTWSSTSSTKRLNRSCASTSRSASTTVLLATSPASWPPMPSATAQRPRADQSSSASSLSLRTFPTTERDAERHRNPVSVISELRREPRFDREAGLAPRAVQHVHEAFRVGESRDDEGRRQRALRADRPPQAVLPDIALYQRPRERARDRAARRTEEHHGPGRARRGRQFGARRPHGRRRTTAGARPEPIRIEA